MIRDHADRKPGRAPWRDYGRRMLWFGALSAALASGTLVWMRWTGTPMPWQGRIAVAAGVFFMMLLTGALMSLVFASARGGHDAAVRNLDPDI